MRNGREGVRSGARPRVTAIQIYTTFAALSGFFVAILFSIHRPPVLTAILLCFASVTFSALAFRLWLKNNHHRKIVYNGWFSAVIVAGLIGCGFLLWLESDLEPPRMGKTLSWKPPQLPENATFFDIEYGPSRSFGSISFFTNKVPDHCPFAFEDFINGAINITGFRDWLPISINLISNRLYVDASIPLGDDSDIVIHGNSANKFVPFDWDMNFSDNAVEVIDQTRQPILQVVYVRPNKILIRGVFAKGGRYVVLGESVTFGGVLPIDKRKSDLKPIFKYPSGLHSGEYAQ
jgi:hypothetical protein